MPTTRPRHAITETEAVAHALDVARRRWPGERQATLLTRLIEAGADAVELDERADADGRRRAAEGLTALAQHYPDGYLEDVRDGWEQ